MQTQSHKQSGIVLIEALIGILIFSLGVLAIIALQTVAISSQSDAQFRVEAANFANRLLGDITLNVDRSSAANLQTSLAAFEHRRTGEDCNAFTGTDSANAIVTNWLASVTAAGTGLPGGTTAMQQVRITTGTFNQVRITVCWRGPNDNRPRRHQVISYIN